MKTLVFFLFLLPASTRAQQILLLDRNFRSPMEVAEEAVNGKTEEALFPVYNTDLDSIITFTEELISQFDENRRVPTESFIKKFGHSYFVAQANYKGSLPQYYIRLVTRSGNTHYAIKLINEADGHKTRVQKLKIFLDYLRNNRLHTAGNKKAENL